MNKFQTLLVILIALFMFSSLYYIFFYSPKQKLTSLHIKTYQEAREYCDKSYKELQSQFSKASDGKLLSNILPPNTDECIRVRIEKLGYNPEIVLKTVVENKSSY